MEKSCNTVYIHVAVIMLNDMNTTLNQRSVFSYENFANIVLHFMGV